MSKFGQKAFWIAAGDLVGRGLGFFTSIYLARVLGLEFFGLITVALSILGYANWFADLGLVNIGIREAAKEPEKRTFRPKEIFNLKVILGALVLLGGILLISIIPMGPIQKQVILGFLYSIVPYSILIDWYYNGRQRFGTVAISKTFTGGMYFLLVVLLVDAQNDVTLVPILYTIGVTTSVVFIATISLFEKPFSLPSRGFKIYKELINSSSLLGLGWFFTQMVTLLPPIVIVGVMSLKDAGVYGAAFRIVIVAMMLDRIFVNLLLPNLSAMWENNQKVARERTQLVLQLIMVGGSLLALLIALNADIIIPVIYGFDYRESIPILAILSIFIFFTFLNSLFSFGLIATLHDREYLMATSFGGTLAAFIISLFAAFGDLHWVATGVVFGEFILMMFSYFWFKKVIALDFWKSFLTMIPLAVVLYFTFSYLQFPTLISSSLSALVMLGTSRILNILKRDDLRWVKEKIFQ